MSRYDSSADIDDSSDVAQGCTRLLLTKVPYFREIIIMSFACPHCHFRDSQIQSAGEIQQKGSRYELRLTDQVDFSRQVVKSDSSVIKFIELDVEVPAGRGQLTNVEGLLSTILEDLSVAQPQRKEEAPEVYAKIEEILVKGKSMLEGSSFPFRLSLDDPSGNSWIEPNERDGVGKWSRVEYPRSREQNEALGLSGDSNETAAVDSAAGDGAAKIAKAIAANPEGDEIVPDEVYSFPAHCPGCMHACLTHMKMVDIPHFKQVIIMATVCDDCGYRTNEVKTGGEIPERGQKITLRVENATDLARDILKSESCALECPEVQLSVTRGTLGGRFTTVEGLLTQVRDDLRSSIFDVGDSAGGDSVNQETKQKWETFFGNIDRAIAGEQKFTIILTDPLAGSYIQNLCAPDADPQITSEMYDRTDEEEDELGLKDMVLEGYEQDDKPDATKPSIGAETTADSAVVNEKDT